MVHIQRFSESIFGKSREDKANEYLGQFKKEYEDRTLQESILVEGLYSLEFTYVKGAPVSLRYLGSMETVLVLEGFLNKAGKFDFKSQEKKFLFIPYTSTETYRELIIRKTKEYLVSKGVM